MARAAGRLFARAGCVCLVVFLAALGFGPAFARRFFLVSVLVVRGFFARLAAFFLIGCFVVGRFFAVAGAVTGRFVLACVFLEVLVFFWGLARALPLAAVLAVLLARRFRVFRFGFGFGLNFGSGLGFGLGFGFGLAARVFLGGVRGVWGLLRFFGLEALEDWPSSLLPSARSRLASSDAFQAPSAGLSYA